MKHCIRFRFWACLIAVAAVSCLTQAGCDRGAAATAGKDSSGSASSATSGGTAVKAAAAAAQRPKVDRKAMESAKLLVRDTCLQIGFMTDDAAFEKSITGVDNALGKIDIEAALKALELLASLPDNEENQFMPTLSKVLSPIREAFTLYKAALADKKPFSNGSEAGSKMAKLAADNGLNIVVSTDESLKLVDDQ